MNKTLSLADMARHFSLPESTARYYCKRFAPFMTIYGDGRRKRYGHECLTVIGTIIEHMKMGKTAQMVEEILLTQFPCTREHPIDGDTAYYGSRPSFDTSATPHMSPQNNFSDIAHAKSASVHEMNHYGQNQGLAHSGAHLPHNAAQVPHGMDGAAGQLLMQYLEQQSSALQSIAQSLSVLAGQKNDMQRLEDAARTSKEENCMLRQEVKVLKNLLHSSEQVHHDDLNQMRSWMSRLAQSYTEKHAESKKDSDVENS